MIKILFQFRGLGHLGVTLSHWPFLTHMIFHLTEDLNELIASIKELGGFPLHVANFYVRTRVNFVRVILIESRGNVLKVARKRKS